MRRSGTFSGLVARSKAKVNGERRLRRAGYQGKRAWSCGCGCVGGWVLLWVGVGLPRRPVDHKGARPGGECQLQALRFGTGQGFWRPGVDIPLLARLASPRLGAEGDQLLQPEDCLTAASWPSKQPGRLRRPTNRKQSGTTAADGGTAPISPRSSVLPTYPYPEGPRCDVGRSAEPTNHHTTATDSAHCPRRCRRARRFFRHGRPMLAHRHWYPAGLEHNAAARHTSGWRSWSPSAPRRGEASRTGRGMSTPGL
jgi:hypothetical protein